MDERLNPPTRAVAPQIGGRLPVPPVPPIPESAPQPRDHYAVLERQTREFVAGIKSIKGYWFHAVGAKAVKGYASPVALIQLRRKLYEADMLWSAMRKALVAMIDSLEQE